jgi:hypothetical protein
VFKTLEQLFYRIAQVYKNIALSNRFTPINSAKTARVPPVSKQKTIILAIILAIVLVFVIAGISYQLFPAQESPPNGVIYHTPPLLDVTLSRYSDATENFRFNITQGETIKINVTLSSFSNDTEFTTPLYLSVGAFENEPLRSAIMITSPPSPYPTLPYPSYNVSSTAPKPFEASFDPNPLIVKPGESGTSILTITTLEAAEVGTYTMFVQMGNWEQTGLGGATILLTVTPNT